VADGGYRDGETALIVGVPEAEPAVGAWRERFDPAAAAGVPAHITVVYPFLDRGQVTDGVLAELAEILGGHRAFGVRLARARRFPGVLYLAPEPAGGLRALTGSVTRRWPEAPPYGGQFAEIVPHLTVADGQEAGVLDMIEADVARRLPVSTRVAAVSLIACAGGSWSEYRRLALGGG
jgi:2'-5' RNA ligase